MYIEYSVYEFKGWPVGTSGMSVKDFQSFVDRHGDNPDEWPPRQRPEALALLSASAEARAMLAEAARIREMAHCPTIKAPLNLAQRILDKALKDEAASDTMRGEGRRPEDAASRKGRLRHAQK